MNKALIRVLTVLAVLVAASLSLSSFSFADETTDFVFPGAIVDFTTRKGYDDFCAKAEEFDLVNLFTGEYTVHGTNGKVKWEFVEEDGESFARFAPIEPLDEKGYDADGKKPEGEGDFRMTAEIEFPVADYNFISFCYRATKGGHISNNQIYIRDDAHSGEFEGTQGMWVANGLKANGEWVVKTIKISTSFKAATGTFKSIRIPITGRVNEYFDLKYIVVYNDKDLCNNFDINAYHEALAALEPEPTAEPEPTEAPAEEPTDVPAVIAQPTEEPSEKKKGCGGAVYSGMIFAAAVPAFVLFRKKKR
ncbi:MAG: hypothetical protein J6U38_05620 [Clostridia bacterium]|nr:hypothetical protein [Clostridia bacterium]